MSDTVRRLSKNTAFLYIRMVVLMAITLYTSRVLLKYLGVDDFGLYSVVGSVTATFYSLRAVFAESVQRFLNYEKGRNNVEGETQVFNISVLLHVIIAVVFVIAVELAGLWLLGNKLVIDTERIEAAYSVFHLSVFACAISILIIPFDALIIANEKMNVYAWVSIFDGLAKLLFVLVLPLIPNDRLITYAFLLAIIPIINIIVYSIYCRRFPECRYSLSFDRKKVKEIFVFSGWSFGGNLSYTLAHEGLNILINMFGGVVNNAARNIAYQVRTAVNQISNNTLLATKPYLLQNAAALSPTEYLALTSKITRINFFIMTLTCIPIICCCQQLLDIWLVEVPEKAVIFTQFITLSVLIRCIHGPLNLFYLGQGKIKRMVIIESCIFLLMLPICYLALYLGMPEWSVYAILIIIEVVIILALTINLKFEYKLLISGYIRSCIIPCSLLLLLSGIVIFIVRLLNNDIGILRIILRGVAIVVMEGIMVYVLLTSEEKSTIVNVLMKGIR